MAQTESREIFISFIVSPVEVLYRRRISSFKIELDSVGMYFIKIFQYQPIKSDLRFKTNNFEPSYKTIFSLNYVFRLTLTCSPVTDNVPWLTTQPTRVQSAYPFRATAYLLAIHNIIHVFSAYNFLFAVRI